MSQKAVLFMTAGDNDEFIVTLEGVDLSVGGVDFFRIRMRRPSGALEKEGTDIGELADGKFKVLFDSPTDLEAGSKQPVDIKWSISGVVLTAKEHLFITVKEAI